MEGLGALKQFEEKKKGSVIEGGRVWGVRGVKESGRGFSMQGVFGNRAADTSGLGLASLQ